ncbi:MAG: hypothetical protein ABIP29_09045 [Candidatus Eisenbacteria bacterium]
MNASRFAAGQVWRYRTRPGEEGSRAIVGRVETDDEGEVIVHVKLTHLRMVTPHAPEGYYPSLSHIPVAEESFADSITAPLAESPDLAEFEDGYRMWIENQGGVFTISLAEIVEFTEQALQ